MTTLIYRSNTQVSELEMSEYGGFIWVIDEARRGGELEDYIERNGTFTDTISASDWQAKYAEVFLISLDAKSVQFIALAHVGKKIATQKRIVRVSNLFKFYHSLSFEKIGRLLGTQVKSHFVRSSEGKGMRVPPKTWEGVINAIKQLQPNAIKDIDRIHELRKITPQLLNKPGADIFVQERDATNLSLRIADIDPTQITKWYPSQGNNLAPFLQGLQSTVLIEDQMIAHDAEVFGDWNKIGRYMVGASVFEKGAEHLTVMNVNRHKIENTVGVDLIYYFRRYDSYVLLQYKRMLKENGTPLYRLNDDSYHKEIKRMTELETVFEHHRLQPNLPLDTSPSTYRLHNGTFYFKLCPAEIVDITSAEMIKGMYLPLDYWKIIVNSKKTSGPKGGKLITYDNVERYLNNTLFINLVQSGWVGSPIHNNRIITKFIMSALKNKRSVVLSALTG